MKSIHRQSVSTAILAFAGLNVLAAVPAAAQTVQPAADQIPPAPQADPENADTDTVIITGFRASLRSSTEAKREATAFTDTVFAEDIGKFPDLNIAESLTRIPGIQLSRDATGEGLNVSIRGLGTDFSKITLNGSQIAVATPGGIDGGQQNRQVNLDMFPTEFFTRLDVSKSPTASQLEGGVSGNVDMRSARPFDNPGTHLNYQLQYGYNNIGENWSPRAALIGSWTSDDDQFGVLAGIAGVNLKSTITGWESVGWTNASTGGTSNFACAGCSTAFGGNNFFWGPTVPTNAGNGLTTGATVDDAFLLARNPGLTAQQISDGIIPRLGRQQILDGERNRISGLLSLEYRPSDSLQFYFDILGAKLDREFYRSQINWVVRNSNFMVPLNMQVDANNVVTSGTFANSMLFVEDRNFIEDADMINLNPGVHWEVNDWLQTDFQVNYNHSTYFRDAPTVLFNTAPFAGVTVDYDNTGSLDFPSIATNVNINDPNAGWTWLGMSVEGRTNHPNFRQYTTGLGNNGRVNVQNEKRITRVWGAHWDVRAGNDDTNVRLGLAYDDFGRLISGRDNSQAWQNFVCGGGVPAAAPAGFENPLCTGSATPQFFTPDGDPNPLFRGNPDYTTGAAGSAISNSALASFLQPGPGGWVQVDWARFREATNYAFYTRTAAETAGVSTGNSTGQVYEQTTGAYVEANSKTDFLGRDVRLNAGVRYITTDQEIVGPVTIAGVLQNQSLTRTYDAFLPSLNVAVDAIDDVVLRFSGSRTLTRPDPSSMLPNTVFSDPSAQTATQGNPNIAPFQSTNFDIGGEWYTGDEGYVAATFFHKDITGFTVLGTTTIPFNQLGIPFDTLAPNQQTAILSRGGPDVATVTVNQQVNAGGILKLRGYELNWVQPLDMLLDGLGFSANYTRVSQDGEGAGAPAVAVGVSPMTYNATAYYENYGASVRLSYTYQDDQIISGAGQNGIPIARLRSDGRGQLDMSASYDLDWLPTSPQITLNVINITEEPLRTTFQFPNAAFNFREPGRQILIGLRGNF
jgi:TonB-dependent receptor